MRHNFSTPTTRHVRATVHGFRSTVVNVVTALTVNAAIVLSAPRSTVINPAPMVLRVRRRLIDDRWHEGEYVDGGRPSVVVIPLNENSARDRVNPIILKN